MGSVLCGGVALPLQHLALPRAHRCHRQHRRCLVQRSLSQRLPARVGVCILHRRACSQNACETADLHPPLAG